MNATASKKNSAFVLPTPTNASKKSIEAFAEKAASVLGYEIGGELEPIVNKIGGRVHYQWYSLQETCKIDREIPLEISGLATDHYSGVVVVKGQNDFDILLSPHTGILRDRFTIAHELGHYFLHSQQGEIPLIAARLESDLAEWEANWFAAGFLMPEVKVREFCEEHSSDTFRGAACFQVSPQAFEVRVKSLGLTPA